MNYTEAIDRAEASRNPVLKDFIIRTYICGGQKYRAAQYPDQGEVDYTDVLYRVSGEVCEGGVSYFEVRIYPVLKRTKCGAWIAVYTGKGKRFVRLQDSCSFAKETEDEAFVSLKHRNLAQQKILGGRLRVCEMVGELARDAVNLLNAAHTVKG